MLSRITSRQFAEWRAYADLEPFDEERADARAGQVVQTLLNVHRKKGRRPFTLRECVLSFEQPERSSAGPETADRARAQIRQTMSILMAIHNKPARRQRTK